MSERVLAQPYGVSPEPPPRPARIVVVDDSPPVIELMEAILGGEAAYDVVGLSGRDADFGRLVAEAPDLIIVDLRLGSAPWHDGWELVQQARSHPGLRAVPVLVCTADVMGVREHMARILASDAVERLAKPFDID